MTATLPVARNSLTNDVTGPVSGGAGFCRFVRCKLIVTSGNRQILGCHVAGDRAIEIAQVAAVAMSGSMRVDDVAQVPLSFPTYAGVLGRVAAQATRQLNLRLDWQASQIEGS